MLYSYSRIDNFQTCPQSYKLRYVDKIVPADNDFARVGTAAHLFTQRYLTHLVSHKRQTDVEMCESILSEITPSLPRDLRQDLEGIVRTFKGSFFLEDPKCKTFIEAGMAVDRDFTPCSYDDPKRLIRGKVDLLQVLGCLAKITDWKTARVIPPQSEIDQSLQLDIYAIMVMALYPLVKEVEVNLFYLRYGKQLQGKRTRADVKKAKTRVLRAIKQIEDEKEFNGIISSICEYCSYRAKCPVYQKAISGLDLIEIKSQVEAADLARRVLAMDGFVKNAKASLKAWVENSGGAITLETEELNHWAYDETTFDDTEKTVKFLLDHGVDRAALWSSMSISKATAEKLLKGNKAALADLLKRLGQTTPKTRFEFRKCKVKTYTVDPSDINTLFPPEIEHV
jgi:RecB family exonuclease